MYAFKEIIIMNQKQGNSEQRLAKVQKKIKKGIIAKYSKVEKKQSQAENLNILKQSLEAVPQASLSRVPRWSQTFRTNVELFLSFDDWSDYSLGGLGVSPYSFHHKVNKMEINREKIVLNFDLIQAEITPMSHIYNLMDSMNSADAHFSKKYISQFIERIQTSQTQIEAYSTDHEQCVLALSKQKIPHKITVYKIEDGQFRLVQVQLDPLLLRIMGITKEMLQNHVNEYNSLPDILITNNYFENTWTKLFFTWSQNQESFSINITTYEGEIHTIKIHQQQFQIPCDSEQSSYMVIVWSYEVDEFLKFHLLEDEERIKANSRNYYCSFKDQAQIMHENFQERMGHQKKVVNVEKVCGYRMARNDR